MSNTEHENVLKLTHARDQFEKRMRSILAEGSVVCFNKQSVSVGSMCALQKKNRMGSVVLKSLSVLLGLFFIFIGTMKLSSILSKDLHKDLRKEYVKYAKVFPLSQAFDFKIPAKWYRRVIGGLELVCGLAMALVPIDAVKQGANITLLLLMVVAVYSHYMVNDKFERTAPALVFFFMLTGRMVIEWQLKRKEDVVPTSNGDAKHKKQD